MAQRGSKPGEYRGGRRKGTPNRSKAAKIRQATGMFQCDVERVKAEYGHIAGVDPAELYDADGKILPIQQMPERIRRAIASVEIVDYEEDGDGKGSIGKLHKIKFWDKTKALKDIGQHLGMFVDQVKLSGELTISSRDTLAAELDRRRKSRQNTPQPPVSRQ
jgi:Terminase small subunit